MEPHFSALIVLDTGIVVSALVGPEDTPHHRLIERVASGGVLLALSDASLSELSRVVGYPDVEPQIRSAARALRYGLDLGLWATRIGPLATTGLALRIARTGGCSIWHGRPGPTAL